MTAFRTSQQGFVEDILVATKLVEAEFALETATANSGLQGLLSEVAQTRTYGRVV